MRHPLVHLLTLVTAAAMTLPLATPAAASKPVPGEGNYWVVALDPDGCVVLGVSGTLAGSLTLCTRGRNGTDKATFEGTVQLAGSTYVGTATIGFSRTDRFTVLSGSGGLAGLHGQGVATDDPTGLAGTYTGRFHFDP